MFYAKRHAFTLVEMLVVVAIVILLAGILAPSIHMSLQKAKVARTRSDMNSIRMALMSANDTYGNYVNFNGSNATFNRASISEHGTTYKYVRIGETKTLGGSANTAEETAYTDFMAELSDPTNSALTKRNINQRCIRFLNSTEGYSADKPYTLTENDENLWRDPWGMRYVILINTDGQGMLDVHCTDIQTSMAPDHIKIVPGDVQVYSCGPNTNNEFGFNFKCDPEASSDAKARMCDDIATWHTP
ncbi:MAG: prepilin-type N-terminal cleavage/methylation domain-containing protein [Victivallaceae bacterium]|nr:prepilin-type N-terminal cleavage/methylation domain-containing protein [Victivallaceae bacterium]